MATALKKRATGAVSDSHGRILDAAEEQFGKYGFGGVGMKAISQEAGVAQGLLHYHFGTKEGLYEAVISRQAEKISNAREALLERIDLTAENALEEIFDALYRPTFEDERSAKAYAIIFSGKYVGERDQSYLVNKYYDVTAARFIDAIVQAEPGATRDIAAWSYILAIGAMLTVIGQDGRQERLSGIPERGPDRAREETIRHLVQNAVGGLRYQVAAARETG